MYVTQVLPYNAKATNWTEHTLYFIYIKKNENLLPRGTNAALDYWSNNDRWENCQCVESAYI